MNGEIVARLEASLTDPPQPDTSMRDSLQEFIEETKAIQSVMERLRDEMKADLEAAAAKISKIEMKRQKS